MQLTKEQRSIIKELTSLKKRIQILSGYAGTGKSTIIQHIAQVFPEFAYCAYTGKAASVLRKMGVSATTIHSLIYKPLKDEFGNLVLDNYGNPTFTRAAFLDARAVIIDEASMVSKEIYDDLCSFNVPLIFVGDGGQLEPIGDKFNIMENPDYSLEEIHRNAGEIAFFGEHIRKGFRPASFSASKKVQFISKFDADKYYLEVDQILCTFNKTRVQINQKVREKLGYPDKPQVGDRVICLRNNHQLGIFNGLQGTIKEIDKNIVLFESEIGPFEVWMDFTQFNKEKYEFELSRETPNPFDYAYGSTTHKFQGSQANKGLVIEQKCQHIDHKRLAYTAATRFIDKVYWAS